MLITIYPEPLMMRAFTLHGRGGIEEALMQGSVGTTAGHRKRHRRHRRR